MLNNLLFASLLAIIPLTSPLTVTTAAADARAPIPPRSNACLVTMEATSPVFQIERKSDVIKDFVETKLLIVSNGAWTYTETKNRKVIRTEAGCLSKPDLAALTGALATATWTTTMAEMRCMAYPADYLAYSYQGKPVLTSRMCDGQILDKVTQKAMATATAITSKLVPARP